MLGGGDHRWQPAARGRRGSTQGIRRGGMLAHRSARRMHRPRSEPAMEWRPDFGVSNRAHVWWRLGFLVRLLTLNRLMLATPSSAATASRMALTSSSASTRMTNMSRALGPESTRTRTWTTMASEEVPVGVRELVLRRNSPRPIVPQMGGGVWCACGRRVVVQARCSTMYHFCFCLITTALSFWWVWGEQVG